MFFFFFFLQRFLGRFHSHRRLFPPPVRKCIPSRHHPGSVAFEISKRNRLDNKAVRAVDILTISPPRFGRRTRERFASGLESVMKLRGEARHAIEGVSAE